LIEQRCLPIWLKKAEIEKYDLYLERFIKPLFHNFKGTEEEGVN